MTLQPPQPPLPPEHPMLRQPCQPIIPKDLKSKSFQKLLDHLLDFVYGHSNKGLTRNKKQAMTVGLSANQIGISLQINIIDLGIGHKSYNDIHILINPRIIWKSKSIIEKIEGCVNLPTIWGQVKRSRTVTVQALDRSGNQLTIKARGWPAVLLQHEIDHLHGHLFLDRLSDPTKAHLVEEGDYKLYKKQPKNWTKFIDVTNLTRPIL